MPRNQFQRMIFAFLTVVVTVHAYVFYSLYVVNGATLMSVTGEHSVLDAIRTQGGVYMFGRMCPIWSVVLVEFCFAYLLEIFVGSPASFKLACRKFDPAKNHPMIFESAIINATVGIMCPVMSFIAALLYYPYYSGFNGWTFLANWIKLICFNFPFAYFSQMYFIQPFVRTCFRTIFRKDIAAREQRTKESGSMAKPTSEAEAIENVIERMNQIERELKEELAKK